MSQSSLQPLVSIVMPSRNHARYVEEGLRSCLNQTYRNLEVVVVDESTDETPAILRRLQEEDPRVRVYYEKCGSLPAALNYGFRWTQGDFLTWAADDDLYEPEAIQRMVQALLEHPDVGLVYCNFKNIDENGRVLDTEIRGEPSEMDQKSVVGRFVLWRREVYAKVGDHSVEDWLNEDDEYYLRIRDHYKLLHLDAVLSRYRWHPTTLTDLYRYKVLLAQHRTWAKRVPNRREARRIMGDAYMKAAGAGLYLAGRRQAIPFLVRGLMVDPLRVRWLREIGKLLVPRFILKRVWDGKWGKREGADA